MTTPLTSQIVEEVTLLPEVLVDLVMTYRGMIEREWFNFYGAVHLLPDRLLVVGDDTSYLFHLSREGYYRPIPNPFQFTVYYPNAILFESHPSNKKEIRFASRSQDGLQWNLYHHIFRPDENDSSQWIGRSYVDVKQITWSHKRVLLGPTRCGLFSHNYFAVLEENHRGKVLLTDDFNSWALSPKGTYLAINFCEIPSIIWSRSEEKLDPYSMGQNFADLFRPVCWLDQLWKRWTSLDWSEDEQYLAGGNDQGLIVWKVPPSEADYSDDDSWRCLSIGPKDWDQSKLPRFNPLFYTSFPTNLVRWRGRFLLTHNEEVIRVWGLTPRENLEVVWELESPHPEAIVDCNLYPGGLRLAISWSYLETIPRLRIIRETVLYEKKVTFHPNGVK